MLGWAMTFREVAERALFATSLEEKLAPPPAGLLDEDRGRAICAPDRPGRPENLALRQDGVRAAFPGATGIEDNAHCGKLLHFFANHELLATELMALVLLKFPDAPAEFRAGVLRTLREEQVHTRLYLKRMAECGVQFGDFPVNGFFWGAVSGMPTPLDYVTRLSLTFEQANLDYARGYAQAFAEAGDRATASLLERIYRDEIGHVSYGLEWFRKWKRKESDWQAFVSRLHLPLSAARAKGGFSFNEEGRRDAGLNEEFIRELRVYAQSKGRTPNVFWFNPGAEESLVLPPGVTSRAARQVERDLAILPAYLARREDVVLVPEAPPRQFLETLLAAGIELPEIVSRERTSDVAGRKLHELRPWARTPDAGFLADSLGGDCVPTARELFSKATHASFLRELLGRSSNPLLCPESCAGRWVTSVEDLHDVLASSEEEECILKAPFSTAGRDRVLCRTGLGIPDTIRDQAEDVVSRQGGLVVEPWLSRVIDFSLHYDVSSQGVRRRGVVVIDNTRKGQFRSATVAERFTDFLRKDERRALFEKSSRRGLLMDFVEEVLEPGLSELVGKYGYVGPLGIDAFLYRDRMGSLRLKPVVEINPRYTMGRVALELTRFNHPQRRTQLVSGPLQSRPAGALALTPTFPSTRWAAWLGSSAD